MAIESPQVLTIIILGVLCFVMLIIVIVLSIVYHRERQNNRKNFSYRGLLINPKGGDKESSDYCGEVSYGDPRAFGPIVWQTIHIMAQFYPENPSDIQIKKAKEFIQSLSWMIPCSQCGRHLQEFLEYNESNIGLKDSSCMGVDGESVCMSLDQICSSRTNLVSFFVRAHNNVSEHVNPDRKRFSISQAEDLYTDINLCFHNSSYGGEGLDRSQT